MSWHLNNPIEQKCKISDDNEEFGCFTQAEGVAVSHEDCDSQICNEKEENYEKASRYDDEYTNLENKNVEGDIQITAVASAIIIDDIAIQPADMAEFVRCQPSNSECSSNFFVESLESQGNWIPFASAAAACASSMENETITDNQPVKSFFESDDTPEYEGRIKIISEDIVRVLYSCFLTKDKRCMSKSFPLDITLNNRSHVQNGSGTQNCPNYSGVWNSLKIMEEETIALTFHWTNSDIRERFLASMSIDTRNILPNHGRFMPVYAANLGLLEPKRTAKIDGMSQEFNDQSGEVIDTNSGCNALSQNQEISEVEFDWLRSGLCDPLDAYMKEREFLELLEIGEQMPFTSRSVASLLAISTTNDNDEATSVEALHILDKLPSLTFMTSRTLIFPLLTSVFNN